MLINRRTFSGVGVLFSFIFAASCVNHDLGPDIIIECEGAATVSFAADIQPILSTKCAIPDCHNGSLGEDRNWTIPSTFQAHKDEAHRRVQLPDTDPDQMPKEGSITYEQKKLIVCWVEQGAPIDN